MPMPTVDHIANVSFKGHFLPAQGASPKNGSIQVNHNTFDVTFANGKVNAKFASGNWFTNFFRSSTLSRFTQTLQTQYDNWLQETQGAKGNNLIEQPPDDDLIQHPKNNNLIQEQPNDNLIQESKPLKTQKNNSIQETHAAKGFKDNPNVAAVDKAIDKCIDVLYGARGKIDSSSINYPKEIMKAYAMPNANIPLDEEQAERLELVKEDKTMPLNMGNYLKRLGEIGMLARIRNELTNVATGTECHDILKVRYGFLTHMPNNCKGLSEEEKKRYILKMLDSIIEGFIAAVDGMKDMETQVVDFLERFTGACVEAKNDNIMDYISLANNIESSGRSDETKDLAYSITAEFNALADEVKAPFRDAARKEVEADVRAECKKNGIVAEAEIEERIKGKVEMKLMAKDDEIGKLVEEKLKAEGKSFLYQNLCGSLRPATTIEWNGKAGDDGAWKVTTLVDKQGNTIKKPVSAYDIDKNFDAMLAMYKADAYTMMKVQFETKTTASTKFATATDMHATGVIKAAKFFSSGDKTNLILGVKEKMPPEIQVSDEELEAAVKTVLNEIIGTGSGYNDEEKIEAFGRYARNYVTSAYKDAPNDGMRLVHLVARRIEVMKGQKTGPALAGLDGKAERCAEMLKSTFPGKVVNVSKAKEAIAKTLKVMIERGLASNSDDPSTKACRLNLGKIMYNGRLFTDQIEYDLGRRPGGKSEVTLKNNFSILLNCIDKYGGIDRNEFISDPVKKEVAA